MSLSEICFLQIKDDFWLAQYDCYIVTMMKSCGWINATKLCSDEGKQFEDWKSRNVELLEALAARWHAMDEDC